MTKNEEKYQRMLSDRENKNINSEFFKPIESELRTWGRTEVDDFLIDFIESLTLKEQMYIAFSIISYMTRDRIGDLFVSSKKDDRERIMGALREDFGRELEEQFPVNALLRTREQNEHKDEYDYDTQLKKGAMSHEQV